MPSVLSTAFPWFQKSKSKQNKLFLAEANTFASENLFPRKSTSAATDVTTDEDAIVTFLRLHISGSTSLKTAVKAFQRGDCSMIRSIHLSISRECPRRHYKIPQLMACMGALPVLEEVRFIGDNKEELFLWMPVVNHFLRQAAHANSLKRIVFHHCTFTTSTASLFAKQEEEQNAQEQHERILQDFAKRLGRVKSLQSFVMKECKYIVPATTTSTRTGSRLYQTASLSHSFLLSAIIALPNLQRIEIRAEDSSSVPMATKLRACLSKQSLTTVKLQHLCLEQARFSSRAFTDFVELLQEVAPHLKKLSLGRCSLHTEASQQALVSLLTNTTTGLEEITLEPILRDAKEWKALMVTTIPQALCQSNVKKLHL